MTVIIAPETTDGEDEIWEPHPVYPHEGSSLGRVRRIGTTKILAQRPNGQPESAPPDQQYQLVDIWMPRPPCVLQPNGRWKHLPRPDCKCRDTVGVHVFITECRWGLKKFRRQVARHGPLGPAVNAWFNLKGWGFPEDNNGIDKDPEVRAAAARTARAAQMAQLGLKPRRKKRSRKVTLKITFRLPWPRKKQPVTAGRKPISKPVTKERSVTGR